MNGRITAIILTMEKSNARGHYLGSKSKSALTHEWTDHSHYTMEKSSALSREIKVRVHLLMNGRIPAIILTMEKSNARGHYLGSKSKSPITYKWTDHSHYTMEKSNARGHYLGSRSKSALTHEWMDHSHYIMEKSNARGIISEIKIRMHLLMNRWIPAIILWRSPMHGDIISGSKS